jgi:preprotein translocase subunit SecG
METDIVEILLKIVHVFVCLVLMFVVLLQQGRGGGMGAAFGGAAAAQVFGGRGAGNILTRATSICAGVFMLTSVALAYKSTGADRAMKARQAIEEKRRLDLGLTKPEKKAEKKPEPAPEKKPEEGAPMSPENSTPTESPTPSPSPAPTPSGKP